jgi:hypothetical protein
LIKLNKKELPGDREFFFIALLWISTPATFSKDRQLHGEVPCCDSCRHPVVEVTVGQEADFAIRHLPADLSGLSG